MADNVEIQGLEFQIQENSEGAVSGLNNLKKALSGLKGATNTSVTGLNATSKSIRELKNALSGLNSGDVSQKLTRLASGLKSLEAVKNIKISSSIANQITALNSALANLKWTDGDKLRTLAEGLQPLSELGKANMTTFINQLRKLPEVIDELEKADIDKFTQQMKDLAAAMKPFADEMQKVSNGFSAFPSKIQRLITSTNRYNTSVNNATTGTKAWSAALTGIKLSTVIYSVRRVASAIAQYMYEASEWEGIMYRFGRAFGDEAEANYQWIKRLNSELQINVQQFMQYSSIYGTMLRGFGVAQKDAAAMAINYTELTYDIWAGYNDIYTSFEDAAIAVRSAIAGEVEPIRRAGFTIVDSQLKITAANYGIAYSTQSASEELKSYLRYLTLVDQARAQDLIGTYAREMTTAEGLMRTLRQQLSSLAQAFGSLLLPALVKVLPYVQAFVELINEAIVAIAQLFGVELQPVDFSGISTGAGAAEDLSDNLSDAGSAAKKLKQYTAGFDELNVFSPDQGSSGAGVGAGGGSYDGMFDIEKLWDESIFENINSQVDELKEKLRDVLAVVGSIAAGIAAWKVAKDFITALELLRTLGSKNFAFKLDFQILGLTMFLADLKEFERYLRDFLDNGPTFQNVAGMISEFAGMVGDALIVLGKLKWAGALKVVQGIGEIVVAIKDISENGVNWDNALTAIRGLTNIAIGIGVFTGNIKVAAWSVVIQGFTTIIREIATNWEAIKQGDWSGVDKVTLIIGALEVLGGLVVALDAFSKLKGITSLGNASTVMTTVSEAVGTLDTTVSTGLSPRLTSLAKNLGLGVAVIAEVAAAAIIFVGAIAILGTELEQVGKAWEPVIENGETVITAIGLGTALLGGVGLAAYALGTGGVAIATNIGIGTAILLELGVATGLFVVEVWAIGKGLDEIGQAWQPVIDSGETIATGIGVGTGLLVAIGVVTAALGAATVASVGLLPVAVGLGTAILVELAAAFVAFTASLVSVADELNFNLAPSLNRLNTTLPQLTVDMSNFVDFMSTFAGEISSYTDSMGGITWDSIVSGFQKLFAGNPIGDFADDVADIATDTASLNAQLRIANPELQQAVILVTRYSSLIQQLQTLLNDKEAVVLSGAMFVNMQEVGANLVTGFASGMNSQAALLNESFSMITNGIQVTYTTMLTTLQTQTLTTWQGVYTTTVTQWTLITTYLTTTWTTLSTTWTTTLTTLSTGWSTGWTQMTTEWQTFRTTFQTGMMEFSTQTTTEWSTMWTNMSQTWTTWKTEFTTGYETFETEFSSAWSSMWRGMTNTTIIQWNSVLTVMEKGMNNAISALNDVIRSINAVAWITGISLSYFSKVQLDRIAYMAEGGFVDEGQLFIARESGAEMVGAMGRRTAVANNDQIVEGIAAGVSNANDGVIAAIYALMNIIEDKDFSVSIGDEVIGRSYDRYNRNRGVRVNSGAFSNAY